MIGIVVVIGLSLFIPPWSPSPQPVSFSLALDLDDTAGDQAVSSLDLLPDQSFSIQIFGSDIQNATGISVRLAYEATQLVYEGFDAGEALPDANTLVEQDSTSVGIDVSSLSGSATANAGWVGTVHFRTSAAFSDTEVWLVHAELARGGETEAISPALGVALQVTAPPSPDFDGNGLVGFSDFVAFAGAFGARKGDGKYEAVYDLYNDGTIAFDDFVIFASSFGEAANRAPAFAASPPVTRSVEENTQAGRPIGDPVIATDADGDSLNYSLRGVHADRFSIEARTGQILTKDGIAYDHEARERYSVTVRASDGQGGRATVVVGIAVTDVDEPPSGPPEGVAVAPRDTALTVTWTAAPNEAGKPPVSGYEAAHRAADAEAWQEGLLVESRTDTGVTIAGLTNEQPYQVRVRTLNEEGAGPWSEPVVGAPTEGPRPLGVIGDQTVYVDRDLRVNLASLFTRPALGTLTYGATSSDDAIATVAVSDTMATVRGVGAGRATVTATAGNTHGATARATFDVVVTTVPPPPPPRRPPPRPPPPPPPPPRPPPGPNQAPTFHEGSSATRTLAENTTGVQDVGDPVSATDPENTPLTYSLEGQDADAFTIDTRSGQLRTKSDQTYDYETKPRYVVDVKATDGHGREPTIPVLINLNDVNEPPAFTSDAAFETVENGATVGAVVAQDEDSADHITGYTLTGGADRDRFEIDSGGALTFKNAPDFEDPADNGRNNQYSVVVTATGGAGGRALTVAQTLTVTVTDVNEPPGRPDPATVSNETDNSLTVTWTEPASTGPDITNYHVQYRDSGAFTDWPDTGPSLTRTITGLSSGSTYQIRVQAENDEGKGAWSNSANGTTLTGPSPTITLLRGPYLQSGTSSSVIIKWRTDEATESVVHYGLDPNSLTLSASNATSTTEHAVQLTGLSADVKYFYSVGTSSVTLAGGDSDHFVVTAPVPGTAKPTRIWVIGDSGTANRNARAVRDAFLNFTGSRDPDLWIMLGDNAYDDGTDNEYRKAVFNTYPQVLPRTVLWPTLGNHDGRTADSTTESGPYYEIFSLPRNGEAGGVASGTEAYYSFDYGNMHFICLDSKKTDRSADGAMMTWLEADLAAERQGMGHRVLAPPPLFQGIGRLRRAMGLDSPAAERRAHSRAVRRRSGAHGA